MSIWISASISIANGANRCLTDVEAIDPARYIALCETKPPGSESAPSPMVLFRLGAAHAKLGHADAALKNLNMAISLRPEFSEALSARGLVYATLGQNAQALADLDSAIRIKPNNYAAFNDRGTLLRHMGRPAQAVVDFDRALRIVPRSPVILSNRANAYVDLGDYSLAVKDLDLALQFSPNNPVFLNNRCWARTVSGAELSLALRDCNDALGQTLHPEILQTRCITYFRMRRFREAISDCDTVIRLNPPAWSALFVRGLARMRLGETRAGGIDVAKARAADASVASKYEWLDSSVQ